MGGSQYAARRRFREASAGHRERIRGLREVRRLLKRMPDAVRDEILAMLEETGRQVLSSQQAAAPRRTGALASGLSMRLSRATLRLRVGIVGKPAARRLFYGRIVEFGRKAQTVMATRGNRLARPGSKGGRALVRSNRSIYEMRVRAMAPRPFVRTSRAFGIRNSLGGRLSRFWDGALARAGGGGDG
jgi:hypothetical protein